MIAKKTQSSFPQKENTSEDFLKKLGTRVRQMRGLKGMSAQLLANHSNISQRYINQLETGKGNISISLLYRIAVALQTNLENLIGNTDHMDSEFIKFTELYKNAPAEQKYYVNKLLEPSSNEPQKNHCRIALIGLKGAGKTTLGKLAAKKLNLKFIELHTEIENNCHLSINEIIELYGYEGYRKFEKEVLNQITKKEDKILIAVSGGVVAAPETYNNLLHLYHTIWLKAEPTKHMQRVQAQGDKRPTMNNPDAMNDLKNILKSRQELYSKANDTLDTSHSTVEQSLKNLLGIIKKLIKTI